MTNTNTNTYAAQLAQIRMLPDVVAYAARCEDLPRPDMDVTDPAESSAVRALSVVSALAPYAEGSADDFETAISDLVADVRHLAKHRGVDWAAVDRNSEARYLEELPDAS